MLLRRVTQHVKEQNWFAVSIDLVIVVFGVYIGIQVSNWNEDRIQREVTTVLVKRLADDLDREYEVFIAELEYFTVVKKYALHAMTNFTSTGQSSDKPFIIAAYQASQQSGVWGYRSAYEELIRSGNINLIKK